MYVKQSGQVGWLLVRTDKLTIIKVSSTLLVTSLELPKSDVQSSY